MASWDDGTETMLSVRHSVFRDGRFDPHSSGEVPIELLGPMADLVIRYLRDRSEPVFKSPSEIEG